MVPGVVRVSPDRTRENDPRTDINEIRETSTGPLYGQILPLKDHLLQKRSKGE